MAVCCGPLPIQRLPASDVSLRDVLDYPLANRGQSPSRRDFSHEPSCPPAGSRVRMFPRPQSVGGTSMDLWVIGVVLALGAATYGLYWLVDALRSAP